MPSKVLGRDAGDAADADVALGLAGGGAGDEGVREDHRARGRRAGGEVAAHAGHRLRQRGLVAAVAEPPRLEQRGRVEVGEGVDRDVAVLVAEQDGSADRGRVGAHEDACGVHQAGAEAEALGAVVVAAAHHDPRARGGQPGEGLVGEGDGVDVGEGPVVDVARDDHDVDPLGLHDLEQVVHERRLVPEQSLAVEGPPQVPVGGVEDAHTTNLGGRTDSAGPPRRGASLSRSGRCGPAR